MKDEDPTVTPYEMYDQLIQIIRRTVLVARCIDMGGAGGWCSHELAQAITKLEEADHWLTAKKDDGSLPGYPFPTQDS